MVTARMEMENNMPEHDVMPECQQGIADIRVTVGVLEHDIIQQTKITDKLAEAIEKIEQVNINLLKMIAVHEEKHENTTEDIRELERRFEGQKTVTTTTTTSGTEEAANKKLKQLEKWIWMIAGGAIVIGWMLAHLKWTVLINLFGG